MNRINLPRIYAAMWYMFLVLGIGILSAIAVFGLLSLIKYLF